MKKQILNFLLLLGVFTYNTHPFGYNPLIDVEVNRKEATITDYSTGFSQTLPVRKSGNRYKGTDIDLRTGRLFDIEIDEYGDVDIWRY